MKTKIMLSLLAVALVSSCQYFKNATSDDLVQISTEDLAAGLKAKTLQVFDNNTRAIFEENHIPGAVYMDVRHPDVALLPQDKAAHLVFYCKNTWCMASHAGARFAMEQGYKNSRVYGEGIDGWIKAGQPVAKGK